MTDHKALAEFHELLRAACEDRPPSRPQSVLYQACRATLMGGSVRAFLPGFVRQCASIERFREFIHLYDRDPPARVAFVDGALAAGWAHLGAPPVERAPPPGPSPTPAPAAAPAMAPPPPPAVLDEDDGFMDDPDWAEEDDEPEPARPGAPRAVGFASEAPPFEARMRHGR